ncbi:MAG: FAD binding domain-containing protein [Spirochaetia bacterium]|nr:FAD binding domain-containing protein [Spirochaetia bacterium]
MEIINYTRPASLDEAYTLLKERQAYPLGGGTWSRLNSRKIDTAMDLTRLDLRFIRRIDTAIEIGAMSTARDLETSPELKEVFGGLFPRTLGNIVGVQMRNIVTVGGTVAGRYGFSDLNTTLLAMAARVVLYRDGTVDFEDFLNNRSSEPVLVEKILLDTGTNAAFQSVRNSAGDFAALNAAAAFGPKGWRIAVGARPGRARLAATAGGVLGADKAADPKRAEQAGSAAAEELSFGSDIRGEAEYRREICRVLVKRAVMEVAE